MKYRHLAISLITLLLFATAANAQKAEVTVTLNEQFFDALLDSVFNNFEPPKVSIAQKGSSNGSSCDEAIKLVREIDGVRTAIRFRDGRVYMPIAFSGSYEPPFVGCVDFAGWAEANIDLEFDTAGQRLIGRIHVLNVNLNGTGGLGGILIAKMLQSSIDKRINPIEILKLDKISFLLPIPNTGELKVRAVSVRPEIGNGFINVRIGYEFLKP